MTRISLVAAIDEQYGLGYKNALLCHLPLDLKHFKALTMGKPIVMGRKTHESIGRLLPGRLNIILSRTLTDVPGARICHSLAEVLAVTAHEEEIMIIGGADVFQIFMPHAQHLYITQIHHHFDADVFFTPIDSEQWVCVNSSFHAKSENNIHDLTFFEYQRKKL